MWKVSRVLLLLLIVSPVFGDGGTLTKTYPTSPVTTVRLEAITESLNRVFLSTDSFKTDEWGVLGSSWTWAGGNQAVNAFYSVLEGTEAVVVSVDLTLKEYTDLVYQEGRLRAANEVGDLVEQFMVYPDTSPPEGWLGWCSQIINGKVVPVACPN